MATQRESTAVNPQTTTAYFRSPNTQVKACILSHVYNEHRTLLPKRKVQDHPFPVMYSWVTDRIRWLHMCELFLGSPCCSLGLVSVSVPGPHGLGLFNRWSYESRTSTREAMKLGPYLASHTKINSKRIKDKCKTRNCEAPGRNYTRKACCHRPQGYHDFKSTGHKNERNGRDHSALRSF